MHKVIDYQDSFHKSSYMKNSMDGVLDRDADYIQPQNVMLDVLDRVPVIDRSSLPISQVIDIIPRQLFRTDLISIRNLDVESIAPVKSHSAIYLPGCDQYAYITGLLFYECISNIIETKKKWEKEELKMLKQNYSQDKNLYIPKIIILVCRKPIYWEMSRYLDQIYYRMTAKDRIPIESMIKNLIFETSYLKSDCKFTSEYWGIKQLSYNDCKHKYYYEVFMRSQESENIFRLLETMIAGIPILLVSTDIFKLVSMVEVLKSLLFPFEYQGLVVPYEPKPQLKLILSWEPYLIGIELDTFESIKDMLDKQSALVYDLNQKEFVSTSNSSRILCRLNNHNIMKKKKILFPTQFKGDTQYKLNVKLQSLRAKHPNDYEKIYTDITEIFIQFFVDCILDIKNMDNLEDYCDVRKMEK